MATLATYVTDVWYRISQGKPEQEIGIYRVAIEQSLNDALQRLGQNVAASSNPSRLQKSIAHTLSSGDVAINAAIVVNSLPSATLTLSGITEPLQYVPNYQDLLSPLPFADFHFFTLHENKIKVRDSLGAAPSATALTVFANYTPVISEVPDELTSDLYDIGVSITLESMNQMAVMASASSPPMKAS